MHSTIKINQSKKVKKAISVHREENWITKKHIHTPGHIISQYRSYIITIYTHRKIYFVLKMDCLQDGLAHR